MFSHYEECPRCVTNGRDSRRDNLGVYSDGGAHCFSCGYHVYPKYYKPKPVELNVNKSKLPGDFQREIPKQAWEWLLSYGLPISYWFPFTGYSPKEERLVFTVGGESSMAFSIGRYVGERIGKEAPRKWHTWGDSHKHTEVIGNEGNCVVVVEDLISAHKVGQVNTCIPLFGTNFHNCHYYYLIQSNKPVILWLDKDQELNVKRKALQVESVINNPVKVVVSEKDPKELSFDTIKGIING